MTSYELLEFYEEVYEEIRNLGVYTEDLRKLVSKIKTQEDSFLKLIYPNDFTPNNFGQLKTIKSEIITDLKSFLMKLDILGNYQKLIITQKNMEVIFEKYLSGLVEEKEEISNLLNGYNNVIDIFIRYIKSNDSYLVFNLIHDIYLLINKYDILMNKYTSIKTFILKTENKVEEKENEEILQLQFYDQHIDPEYFIRNIQAIRDSYEVIFQIFNISLSDNELKVLKIESGSLLLKIIGDASIIGSLAFLLKKTTELIFNKFTLEGKIMRHKQILDLMVEDEEVVKKYKELGLDISFGEDITKYHYQIVKSIGKLVGQTTKIKINNEELSLEENLKQKYLTESQILLIEESITKKDSEKYNQ